MTEHAEREHQERLTAINERIVVVTKLLRTLEGQRDQLQREDQDYIGCHDTRVCVR